MNSLKNVKDHFEEEAKEYDELILKLIPKYDEMIKSLIISIPFEDSKEIKVLDLGSGTGNITIAVKKRYTNAKITCVDLAERMINIAQYKLSKYKDINYHLGDLRKIQFDSDYDLIISSLALHHLQTDQEKINIYHKIYDSLKEGGAFYNADNILASSKYLENVNIKQWKDFMRKNISSEEIEEKWLPTYYKEDYPAPLITQVDWLREIGFKNVDITWKYINGAVFGGIK
ncbi:MAG: class I SAM-dependent methyltransferase [Methanobacterium sp.]|nr:class I SAM-dependent methyltransferase [Methanobacterium sp.]